MNPDKRNRVSGPSTGYKKRRFGRKKKRPRVFYKKEEAAALTDNAPTEPSESTLNLQSILDVLPSTSSERTTTANERDSTTDIPASARKKQLKSIDIDSGSVENRIFDTSLLYPALQDFLACKACSGTVTFNESDIRGLGCILSITCSQCSLVTFINSSRKIGVQSNAYEINQRVVLAMRSLGHGHAGLTTFCGQMDLPAPVSHSNYDIINKKIRVASESVATDSMRAAMQEKCDSATENQESDSNIREEIVSGDGSWRKRGYTSLQGVSTLIRNVNGKVIDVAPKQSFCQGCISHPEADTEEYRDWFEAHQNNCSANHQGSSGQMEVNGIVDMFKRSVPLHGVRYKNYIGDGDSKVYKSVCDAKPYGQDFEIIKKECVQHVQKRMGTRLRNLKKSLSGEILSDNKGIGGKDRLTASRIDQLSQYYGNAIRSNTSSVDKMYNAIWATFYHKISTDKKPQHHLCPSGATSWCKWQVAKAKNQLKKFHHSNSIPVSIMNAIKPIYKDLTEKSLLERCIGGFTQNSNESFNQCIWKLVPKHSFSGLEVLKIGVNIAVTCFNDGKIGILEIMKRLSIEPGPSAVQWAKNTDEQRLLWTDRREADSTLEARQTRRKRSHQDDDSYAAGAH